MTTVPRQIVLLLIAMVSGTLSILMVTRPQLLSDPRPPRDRQSLAVWLTRHPADWKSASRLSETALDSPSPQSLDVWRSSYAHARRIAPPMTSVNAAFVRGGLFHWHELGPGDRTLVLRAAEPLMRDPAFFSRMHRPLWQLTRDLVWLRRIAPPTAQARFELRSIALTQGLFADYRALREELRNASLATFGAQRQTADPGTLLNILPERLEKADEPLVRGILEELDRRPFEGEQLNPRLDALVDYAVTHDLGPLAGLAPLLATRTPLLRDVTRARAALKLSDPSLAARIELTSAVTGAAEWLPYYLDRARFEAHARRAANATAYLRRASLGGRSQAVLAAEEEVARILGTSGGDAGALLQAQARQARTWVGTCGSELCGVAKASQYVIGGPIEIVFAPSQSDEVAPYVEIYVDDALSAEGEVRVARTFQLALPRGLHQIEVRLINPRTRNGIQRRLRLS